MTTISRLLAYSIIGFGLGSCGGSSGTTDSAFYGGVYRTELNLFLDECRGSNATPTLRLTHTVNQAGDLIVLQIDGAVYEGGPLETADGFQVERVEEDDECSALLRIRYDRLRQSEADFRVRTGIQLTCPTFTCETVYTGTAVRQ